MVDEPRHRPVAKLVLLQQACCDSELEKSDLATLAVVLDACYDKGCCFIGPSAIGDVASINEKTARESIKRLCAAGYLRKEPRNRRSNWLYPNLGHAQENPRLLTYSEHGYQLHRPTGSEDSGSARPLSDMSSTTNSGCVDPLSDVASTPNSGSVDPVTNRLPESNSGSARPR